MMVAFPMLLVLPLGGELVNLVRISDKDDVCNVVSQYRSAAFNALLSSLWEMMRCLFLLLRALYNFAVKNP